MPRWFQWLKWVENAAIRQNAPKDNVHDAHNMRCLGVNEMHFKQVIGKRWIVEKGDRQIHSHHMQGIPGGLSANAWFEIFKKTSESTNSVVFFF